jgi:hypothetical protein
MSIILYRSDEDDLDNYPIYGLNGYGIDQDGFPDDVESATGIS